MKKWSGGVLVGGLTLILVLRYSFIGKIAIPPRQLPQPQQKQQQQKQSAYEFFNNHPPDTPSNADATLPPKDSVLELLNFRGKPSFLPDVEGLNFLYNSLGNFSLDDEESKAMLVWARMRFLLSRSDALPETAQGIKEAASSWKELLSTIQDMKATPELRGGGNVTQNRRYCPYFVPAFNNGTIEKRSTLQIPCGLIEGSSITVIGIPDAQKDGFEIELLGSELPSEEKPPIVLQYKVFLPGQNLTKEPFVVQNAWTNVPGWGKDEKCPDHDRSTEFVKVDGLVKCSAQIVRTTVPDNQSASHLGSLDNSSNVSDGSLRGSGNSPFPFVEGIPFTASLWVGAEGFHMTVNGRHETSFAYRVKLEPWLVSGVRVKGGLDTVTILAKGLPVSDELNLDFDDLELLKAPPVLKRKRRLVLLIGVFSTANNFARRMALRRSWMQYKTVRQGHVVVRFFIGLHKNEKVNYELWKEAEAFGDIQLMPFIDYYSLLTLKTIAIFILGTEILPAKYIMKTDDDAFVRVDEVLTSLKGKASEGLFYGRISFESTPHREKDNKWYISPEEWPYSSFPAWAHGPGYIVSRDIAKFIVQGHRERDLMMFKLEDVAVGIWIEVYKNGGHEVVYVDEERFNIDGCESNYILAHYQSPRLLLCLWDKLGKEHQPEPECSQASAVTEIMLRQSLAAVQYHHHLCVSSTPEIDPSAASLLLFKYPPSSPLPPTPAPSIVCSSPSSDVSCDHDDHESVSLQITRSESALSCSTSIQTTTTTTLYVSPRFNKFAPSVRSGSFTCIGPRSSNEDEHLCVDDLPRQLGPTYKWPVSSSFYAVFDGHGGSDAAAFVKDNALKFFFQDALLLQRADIDELSFLEELENSQRRAFLVADQALAEEEGVDCYCGTTALTALVLGRRLLIANAGDCRAVLCRKGVAVQLSQDHRPSSVVEKKRVEDLGGYIEFGYLNGDLAVTRALGDWYMKRPYGSKSPLTAEPEMHQIMLTEEDEFLIIACDGIWDVMSNQDAVRVVHRELRQHGDPQESARELVDQALMRDTHDNLTAIVVSFNCPDGQTGGITPQGSRLRTCSLSAEARKMLRSLLE
ncbi:OLC1v1020711C1 [Oldenlandia corymbosa var. corymbosa]|uniref:protein-serine/threonine phosphatase n=1 Tax=Oldenlandia corymbosa var. corymbosa TaxID=529605 RepID=A0AAV1EH97_OLDCO|nr:OLC1v1020711C1 [Oldenlandia corymbosa var. corymbosa]